MSGVAIAALVVVTLLALVALAYNRLVTLRNRVTQTWADLEVQLARRHDLVPNLVSVVKGYAAHERETFEAVLAARAAADATHDAGELTEIEERVATGLEHLIAVAEAYPDLKADRGFLELQIELAATEDKIAFSRQLYNDVVTSFATATQTVPLVVLAGPLGFGAPDLYAAEAPERTRVDVRLDAPPAGEG